MDIDDLTPEQQELLKQIQARRKVVVREHRLKKGAANNQAIVPRRNDPRRISNTQTMKVTTVYDKALMSSCCIPTDRYMCVTLLTLSYGNEHLSVPAEVAHLASAAPANWL